MQNLKNYKKQKDYLVCVDSDGCAMDTMDIKHFNCFGPCMVKEWELNNWKDEILDRWNEVNLYTLTRGINRFKGLALALGEINEKYKPIEDLATLTHWVETTHSLSNDALAAAIEQNPESISLKKALEWSKAVNRSINALDDKDKLPFGNVKSALEFAHSVADVAIVSSANLDAVLEEWEKHGLLDHVDIVLAQDAGSKAFCIGEMLKFGYLKENTLMCGDALGDLKAAEENGVAFYPILVRKEKESWQEFMDCALNKLTDGSYVEQYQQQKIREFYENLGAKI